MKIKEDLGLIEASFYKDQSYLTYECKMGSFGFGITSKNISE